jgi:hypothetical protein
MATKKPLPKKYKACEYHIIELAKDGLSKTVILHKLKLPPNFFNAYSSPNPSDWFDFGKALFAETVMKSVRTNLDFSPTERKYLMDKLELTRNEVTLPKMTNAKSAGKVLSEALQFYARKVISDVELQAIRTSAQIYSELHTSVDLQRQIEELRTLIESK